MHDILLNLPLPFGRTLTIHSYGVLAMLGFLAAVLVARWRARKAGISVEMITDLAIWALLAGIVGSRVAYVFENSNFYFDSSRPGWSLFDVFKIWKGGLVFYGGFIGAVIVALVWLRVKKQRVLPVLDVLAPSLALGHAFGRVGCFLHGCCYGVPVSSGAWYGVVFPAGAVCYDARAEWPIAPLTPLFPSQLVEAFNLVVIFVILSLFFRYRRRAGEVVAIYFTLYAAQRFTVEFFRGDTHAQGVLSPAQWISIFIFIAGVGLIAYLRTSAPQAVPRRT